MWRCLRDPTFCRFSRTPTCGRRTDGHTTTANTRAIASVARVKIEAVQRNFTKKTNGVQRYGLPCNAQLSVQFRQQAPQYGSYFNSDDRIILPRDAMLARYMPSSCVCLSIYLSAASRCSTETAKRRITQTTPHDNSRTPVFWCPESSKNSSVVTPNGGANAGRVSQMQVW